MSNITAKSVVEEYNIPLNDLQKLLKANSSFELESIISPYDFDKVKSELNNYKYRTYNDDLEKTATYSTSNVGDSFA